MTNALPSWMYKNPCDVLEMKQNREANELKRSCAGCYFEYEIVFKAGTKKGCEKGRRYGRKCSSYKETT